jgi:two-component system LytT family response regulator
MKKAIIVDDEPLARSVIKEYLLQYPNIQVVHECNDGFEGIKAIMQFQPDIVFLDIQMPKINGFEMLELIEQPPAVVFTTAFDEYAIRAFESHAVDYLLKPFSRDRFDKAIEKWLDRESSITAPATQALLDEAAQSPQQNQRIVVKTGNKIKIIPIDEVHYLEAADDYVKIHTREGAFLKNKTMSHFEKVLNPDQFVRIHRSYIVNVQLVTRIDPYEKENYTAQLKTGAQVPVSKSGYAKLKNVLGI